MIRHLYMAQFKNIQNTKYKTLEVENNIIFDSKILIIY